MRPWTVGDFFESADEMRSHFEARTGPSRVFEPKRQVWDYWFIAGQYAYLRTSARAFFPSELYRRFLSRLRSWGLENLGTSAVVEPWLSYYLDGCRQELHSDVPQGPWAFVFSLTRWEQRRFNGGETMVLSEETLDYWRSFQPGRPLEAGNLVGRIPPRYNQLTIFDARVPHGVAVVEGTRDPLDSRVVLHGWFLPPALFVTGALSIQDVEPSWRQVSAGWVDEWKAARLTGLATVRAVVDPQGRVNRAEVLAGSLIAREGGQAASGEAVSSAVEKVLAMRLRPTGGASTMLLPFSAETP